MDALAGMLIKMENNMLDFTPKCSYDLLNGQLKAMNLYVEYLKERAEIEKIDLNINLKK